LLRRLELLAALAAAVTLSATAAMAADYPPSGCFHARELQDWKSPAPNVILIRAGVNRVFRLDLQQGSDQLKYSDVRLVNRHMSSSWLCKPLDFDLLLTGPHGLPHQALIVTSVRQLTPDELDAMPPRDRP
jgi:hypothetical protein